MKNIMANKLHQCTCPECGQDYAGMSIESSSELGISRIYCSECCFSVEDSICEEDITEQFLQIYNSNEAN